MIAQLRGKITEISGMIAVVDVGGVGYEVRCSRKCTEALQLGIECTVVILTIVREDSITLYGFADRLERQVFLLLTQVKGVGAKSAAAILSAIDRIDLLRLIGAGDVGSLRGVKGIGKKTAERILVELKDRVAEYAIEEGAAVRGFAGELQGAQHDAVEALQSLGFSKKDAERAVQSACEVSGINLKDAGLLVGEALRYV